MSIACDALQIRHPRAHLLPSLTATCQVCTVSLKAGLSTYNGFASCTLNAPDGEPTEADTGVMGVTCQAPTTTTGRLVGELKAEGEEESAHALEKRLAIAQQVIVGHFIVKIDSDGAVFAGLFGCCAHVSPPGHQVSSADETRWGQDRLVPIVGCV